MYTDGIITSSRGERKERKGKKMKFENGMEVKAPSNGFIRTLNRWTKAGKDRVYINGGSRKGDGYVDLISRKAYLGGELTYQVEIAEMILAMDFD